MLSTQIKIGHCFEHIGGHCASCQMEYLRNGRIQSRIGKNYRQNKGEQLFETAEKNYKSWCTREQTKREKIHIINGGQESFSVI